MHGIHSRVLAVALFAGRAELAVREDAESTAPADESLVVVLMAGFVRDVRSTRCRHHSANDAPVGKEILVLSIGTCSDYRSTGYFTRIESSCRQITLV